ncbi:MAG: oxidoreductase [Planctomycetaceae bacterium]|nr:oxidoreductase [Planctomycetaceae bacterium]
MELGSDDLVLVTGATGLVGSHVAEQLLQRDIRTRVITREGSGTSQLEEWGAEVVAGDLTDAASLTKAVDGVSVIVHCAAKVGDWGPIEDYRTVNVRGLESLLDAVETANSLQRFVHISSLGVYEARDHHGTDESEPPNSEGIDGYTLTKVESEAVVLNRIREGKLSATVLRPGFIYGPRDRTVLPRIFERLQSKSVKFLGSGDQLLNNTFVGNLVDAVFLAIERDDCVGEVFNITDGKLVSKREFISTIAKLGGFEVPTKSVPLPVAKALATLMEGTWRILGKKEAPLLNNARIKFLGLWLDFCIDKARRQLGYEPKVEFADGMRETIDWYREQGVL